MNPEIYAELIAQEESHWWFRARRAIVKTLLGHLSLPKDALILEAGCGAGGNLPMLSQLGKVFAFELDDGVRSHAQARNIGHIEAGKLPDAIPFAGTNFDLIALFDVLEHIEDDRAALQALAARLKPGGVLFLTVPAFQFLYSQHDKLHHHFRRYSRTGLKQLIESAGLKIERMSYWNFFLFPVAICARLASKLGIGGKRTPGAATPPSFINELLFQCVSSERFLIPHISLPFGLSLIAVARKH